MHSLAFVVFEEKKRKGIHSLAARSGMLRTYAGSFLFYLLNRNKYRGGIHEFELDAQTDTRIIMIRLPFSASCLPSFNRQFIERYILKIYTEKDCCRCYIPASCRSPGCFDWCTGDSSNYSLVFKSLLVPVLEEIYLKNGLRLDNRDMVLINGENSTELKTMVRQLEPYVRYLNIASADKEAVEAGLADICMESGVSVIVGSNLKSMLRNADLIINMGEISAISENRIRPESVVIHFTGLQNTVVRGESTFISGVDYAFPASFYEAFGEDIIKNYSKRELTQILIECKAGLLNGGIYNEATAAAILGVFKSSSCKITGFRGRRGILKVENILKTLRIY